jgi:hypothetical protein
MTQETSLPSLDPPNSSLEHLTVGDASGPTGGLTSKAVGGNTASPTGVDALLSAAYEDGRADEHDDCKALIAWAYGKLYHINFTKQEDALMLDRMKLLLEHGIHA